MSDDDVHQLETPYERRAAAIVGGWLDGLSQSARSGLSHHDANALQRMIANALDDGPQALAVQCWRQLDDPLASMEG